jgi:putative restriction endonuclease
MSYSNYVTINARKAWPILVELAPKGATITYGRLAKKIGTHHRPLRYVLGYIRDEICGKRNLPLINVLVVKQGGLPGYSFLRKSTEHMSKKEYKAEFDQEKAKVIACRRWGEVVW